MKEECSTCHGFGMWALGYSSAMGPSDARDGYPTVPCPECGANANPVELSKEEREARRKVIN